MTKERLSSGLTQETACFIVLHFANTKHQHPPSHFPFFISPRLPPPRALLTAAAPVTGLTGLSDDFPPECAGRVGNIHPHVAWGQPQHAGTAVGASGHPTAVLLSRPPVRSPWSPCWSCAICSRAAIDGVAQARHPLDSPGQCRP